MSVSLKLTRGLAHLVLETLWSSSLVQKASQVCQCLPIIPAFER
jgi:hypothetical protein